MNIKKAAKVSPSLVKQLNDLIAKVEVLTLRVDDLNASSKDGLDVLANRLDQQREINLTLMDRLTSLEKFDNSQVLHNTAMLRRFEALTKDFNGVCSEWKMAANDAAVAEAKANRALTIATELEKESNSTDQALADLWTEVRRLRDAPTVDNDEDTPPLSHCLSAMVEGIESLLNKSDLYQKDEKLFYALHYWVAYGSRCLGKEGP